MKIYKTLIIGCSYFSVGYAAAHTGTVICEEHQICDTGFYLPLRSFHNKPYSPKCVEGKRLSRIFDSLSLFRGDEQNANGFEFALCKYISEKGIEVMLKCRVISVLHRQDGIYDVTVQTNEGLTHLFAERIIDSSDRQGERHFTVLFVCDDIGGVRDGLVSAFCGAEIESAFYKGRYALHIPVGDTDENHIKLDVYERWRALDIDAKILYMAPVFYGEGSESEACDARYGNPVEAFEAGYFYEGEGEE